MPEQSRPMDVAALGGGLLDPLIGPKIIEIWVLMNL